MSGNQRRPNPYHNPALRPQQRQGQGQQRGPGGQQQPPHQPQPGYEQRPPQGYQGQPAHGQAYAPNQGQQPQPPGYQSRGTHPGQQRPPQQPPQNQGGHPQGASRQPGQYPGGAAGQGQNPGYQNHGQYQGQNPGYQNQAYPNHGQNQGHQNQAYPNHGQNQGHQNPGHQNQGHQNQGHQNQGHQNQGQNQAYRGHQSHGQNQGYQNQTYQNQGYQTQGHSPRDGFQANFNMFANDFSEQMGMILGRSKKQIQIALALVVAMVPILFYLLQPDSKEEHKHQADAGDDFGSVFSAAGAKGSGSGSKSKTPSESIQQAKNDTPMQHAAKHAKSSYVCPMHPDVISENASDTCPICGMDLVLVEAGGEAGAVKLTPTVINTLGVRTAPAKKKTLYRRIDTVGYVDVNQGEMRTISLRTDGWIEKLLIKTEGDRVVEGQPMFEVYSPILVNAQEEYVQSLGTGNDMLIAASSNRLRSLGISQDQILELRTQGDIQQNVVYYSPRAGVITKLGIREGMYVKPAQPVLEIVDFSTVWLMADVFESQADWVKTGLRAEASLPFIPGKSFQGKVDYVYPTLDAKTRSLKVRLQFDNLDESLKPNMYADVTIYAKPKKEALSIPREALIVTGKEKRVIVALGEGKFIPMPVRVGMESRDRVEILSGLAEGDQVVTSSQFLIDSESNLKASLAKMLGGG